MKTAEEDDIDAMLVRTHQPYASRTGEGEATWWGSVLLLLVGAVFGGGIGFFLGIVRARGGS